MEEEEDTSLKRPVIKLPFLSELLDKVMTEHHFPVNYLSRELSIWISFDGKSSNYGSVDPLLFLEHHQRLT